MKDGGREDLVQEPPRVIFLDAVGTLFGVKGSVGEVYSEIARQFGVDAEPSALNQAFFQSFRSATPMAFSGVSLTDVPKLEYKWWERSPVKHSNKLAF